MCYIPAKHVNVFTDYMYCTFIRERCTSAGTRGLLYGPDPTQLAGSDGMSFFKALFLSPTSSINVTDLACDSRALDWSTATGTLGNTNRWSRRRCGRNTRNDRESISEQAISRTVHDPCWIRKWASPSWWVARGLLLVKIHAESTMIPFTASNCGILPA